MRCHYLKDGTSKFAFTIGRAEYFIPVGILLKCFMEVSDKEVFGKLLATIPHEQGEASPLQDVPILRCVELCCKGWRQYHKKC